MAVRVHLATSLGNVLAGRLGLVHGRLGGLVLLTLGDDLASLGELLPQLAGARIRGRWKLVRRGRLSPQHPRKYGSESGSGGEKSDGSTHGRRCYTARSSCLTRTAVPSGGNPGEADSDRRKEPLGTVIDYEILLMLDPELPEERQSEIVTRTRELIEKGGGNWDAHDVWGRRKLAYEIDHKPDGTYHLLTFTAEPEALAEVSRVLRITDGVMRHMAVRRPETGHARPMAPSDSRSQDVVEPVIVASEEE